MATSSFYKQVLCESSYTPAEILKALGSLSHLVYLENNGQPIIGLSAKHYYLIQQNKWQYFKQHSFNHYLEETAAPSLDDLLQPTGCIGDSYFKGGLIGFISYDYAAQQHIHTQSKAQPCLFLGQFHSFLTLENGHWYFTSDEQQAEFLLTYIQNLLAQKRENSFKLTQACTARWNKTEYQQAFNQVQDYIVAGDCYQINLTQEFKGSAEGLLLDTATDFWALTHAPYAGYLKINDFELLSCSPELFIDFLPHRQLLTKPIKGTMPRYTDPRLDEQSKQTLKNSEKDQAENVMIVDLLRNDLSVYAETGSVKTPKLFNIESFKQVHHMVSEITATLKAEINPLDVLLSALPGGSITGAPKIRAMQIIEELEGTPRGAYCGSMGYFNFDGTGSWNILIRSIQKYQHEVSLWAGGGITIASDCDAEYQECFDKVSAMLDLLNTWYTPE